MFDPEPEVMPAEFENQSGIKIGFEINLIIFCNIVLVQETKVVLLEDLAAHFKMKTQDAIDRVKTLQETGDLTGLNPHRQ
jgi:hypothetical protein